MKKINLESKLNFRKETITRLNVVQMQGVNGGKLMDSSNAKPSEAGPSSPCDLQTCSGGTCVYINGC